MGKKRAIHLVLFLSLIKTLENMAKLTVKEIETALEVISQLNLSERTFSEVKGVLYQERRKIEAGEDNNNIMEISTKK